MSAGRHLGFDPTVNGAIRSAVPKNPTLEPNMKRWHVAELWPFEILQNVRTVGPEVGRWSVGHSIFILPTLISYIPLSLPPSLLPLLPLPLSFSLFYFATVSQQIYTEYENYIIAKCKHMINNIPVLDTFPMLWHHCWSGHRRSSCVQKSCCSNTRTFFHWAPSNLEHCSWSQQQYLLVVGVC